MEKTYKFMIPQNKEVESTKVRVENGEMFVDVEFKDKFHPKDGDFLSSSRGNVFIYNGKYTNIQYGAYIGIDAYNTIIKCNPLSAGWTIKEGCRFATPEEKSSFLERLEKECHKTWNVEKKCLEDIYVPKFGDIVRIEHSDITEFKRNYVLSIYPDKKMPTKDENDFFDIVSINMNGHIRVDDARAAYKHGFVFMASEAEKKELYDKLAEVGKLWNQETKKLENLKFE